MDKQPGGLEWIKRSLLWIAGAIAFALAIITLAILTRDNFYLGIVITGIIILGALLGLCVYGLTARDKLDLGGTGALRYERYKRLFQMGMVLIAGFAATLLMYAPSREFVGMGLNSLLPIPRAFPLAKPNEMLLIIVDFDDRGGGKVEVDPAQSIYNLISEKLSGSSLNFRVEQYHQTLTETAEARRILKTYGAAILIWGWFDPTGAELKIELDKGRFQRNTLDSNLAMPESYVMRFTEEIPTQVGYTAFFTLGMMEYQLGITDVAKEFFTEAIASASAAKPGAVNPWEALMWRGNIESWSGEPESAIEDYNQALVLHPHREGYYNRGVVYDDQGQYDLALADYNQAIELDPHYKEAYNNRGNLYFDQGAYELAIADYTNAIQGDPNYAVAYTNRGNTYHAQGQDDLALADHNQAIELDPHYKEAYNNRGNLYFDQGAYKLAVADYTQAIKIDSHYKEAYVNRANTYRVQEQYELALADYTHTLGIDPTYGVAYFGRGLAYYSQGNYAEAIADYTQAIEIDPKSKEVYLNRGAAYRQQNNFEAAIADYTRVIELDPTYVLTYIYRGNAYADQRKFKEAIEDYQRTIALDPKNLYAYCVLGITYTKTGDFSLAISNLEQAMQLDTKSQYPQCKTALDNARLGTPTP